MSETYGTFERRVRAMMNDTRPGDYCVSVERLREVTTATMHDFGSRMGLGTAALTSVALVAGTGDYTLATSVQYAQVNFVQLDSTKEMLCKLTREQMEAEWQDNTDRSRPSHYCLWEDASQVVNVRIRPIPDANDTLLVFGAAIPASLSSPASVIPFSGPVLYALARAVAAECIVALPQADLDKLHLTVAVAGTLRNDAEAALVADEIRRNRLKRTGRNESVDV